jgi:hypothetical protein
MVGTRAGASGLHLQPGAERVGRPKLSLFITALLGKLEVSDENSFTTLSDLKISY